MVTQSPALADQCPACCPLASPSPSAAQAIPSLPEILPFAVFCPARLFISENDTPPRIPVNDHREAYQVPERHNEFPLLRCEVVHCGFRGWPSPIGTTAASKKGRHGPTAGGFGQRYSALIAWLEANCGADGWAITPSGVRGVLNDAVSIYFAEATLAGAFVARWCVGSKVETAGGVFQVREDEPAARVGAGLRRTP